MLAGPPRQGELRATRSAYRLPRAEIVKRLSLERPQQAYKVRHFRHQHVDSGVTKIDMLAVQMDRGPRQRFEPAGAGGILIGVTVAAIAIGALIGWAVGSVGLGCLVGAVVGIPAGVYSVYRRYRGAFS